MYKGSASRKVLAAVSAVAMLAVGCGGTPEGDEKAPVQARQAVRASVPPTVAAGRYHALALLNGTVWAWGSNTGGLLGDGTTTNRTSPVQVQGLTGPAVSVSASEYHSMALLADGTLWTWGTNGRGQLGNGTTSSSSVPVQVQMDTSPSAYLTNVVAAGTADNAQSIALRSDGTVWTWGYNVNGQLGNGTTVDSTKAVRVQLEATPGAYLDNVVAIAAGGWHGLAVRSDGTVWSWGLNTQGQLGDGTTTSKTRAVQVQGLPTTAVDVAAGGYHSLVLLSDGTVYGFGDDSRGQLGFSQLGPTGSRINTFKTATRVGGTLSNVTQIEGGNIHSMAVDSSGQIWAWGNNTYGQLGNGSVSGGDYFYPVMANLGTGTYASYVAAGTDFSIAMATDGTIWTWGANNYTKLGRSASSYTGTPGMVSFPAPTP